MFNKVVEAILAIAIGASSAIAFHGFLLGNQDIMFAYSTLAVVNGIILFFRKTLNNV